MRPRGDSAFTVLFFLVVAPIGAAVLIMVLLLFGVEPQLVFAQGHALKSLLRSYGVPAPNSVGVLATVAAWWVLIAGAGLAWERRPGRKPVA